MNQKLWGGRFEKPTDAFVDAFGASIDVDRRLWREDIRGSIAHARMLAQQAIINLEEAGAIIAGLGEIYAEIERGEFPFSLDHEDIHLNIEARLHDKIGPVAGKLHTARSRNDQVALDTRMAVREAVRETAAGVRALQGALLDQAEANSDVVMPGYTHLQRAQPVLFAHHLLAYFEMLQRDLGRLHDLLPRVNVSPLGSGALAGVPYPIDREAVAAELGFAAISRNSLDAVADRDYLVEYLAAAALIMVHLSRLAEEVIIWSSAEFRFIELDDAYATGSSMMPQKKNPDVAELVRGKTGRVFGHLVALLTVLKGLPLAYNKDLQEDKHAFFDTHDTVRDCLRVFTGMVTTLRVNATTTAKAADDPLVLATDLADWLAGRGVPFRQAHEIVGRLVHDCLASGRDWRDLSLEELRTYSDRFDESVRSLTAGAAVAARDVPGGTSPTRVRAALAAARALWSQAL